MIKNCNECDRSKTCKSPFGGLGCKYKIKPVALALVFFLAFGTVASATSTKEEAPATEETIVIDAENIGIKTIEKEVVEDEAMVIEDESETLDAPVYEEEVEYEKPVYEAKKEEQKQEEIEAVQEEDLSEPPVGMVEGYEEGVYFEPNCFDCEVCESCYKCEECTIEVTHSYDENDNYIREETCIVCGHGTCRIEEE